MKARINTETGEVVILAPTSPISSVEIVYEFTEADEVTLAQGEQGKMLRLVDGALAWVDVPVIVPSRVSKLSLAQAITATNGRRLMTLPSLVPVESREDVEEFLSLSAYIERSHPMIPTVGVLLGFSTAEEIDAVFVLAEKLAYRG